MSIRSITVLIFALGVCCLFGCSGSGSSPDGSSIHVDDAETAPRGDLSGNFNTAADALAEGTKLLDTGETAQAIDVLLQAVKMDPDLAEAFFKLGIAYSLIEKEDQSVENAPIGSSTPDGNDKKAPPKKKNSVKAFESAVDGYKKLIAKNKEDDNAYFYLGLSYNKLNEDEDAAKALKEAVKLKPENVEYQIELGSILIKLAQYHEAVPVLKKAVELDPENVDAQEKLEEAEAGRKRVDFAPPKKDEKKPGDANSNVNANSSGSPANNSSTNSLKPPPPGMKPAKTPAPQPQKPPK